MAGSGGAVKGANWGVGVVNWKTTVVVVGAVAITKSNRHSA